MENVKVDFIINIAKFYTVISKTFDASLWGLWFNDFIVLYYLDNTLDKKLRRIDLANKVGLTASWITRLLLPMEKVWLIKKEVNILDARVSLVFITPAWKTKLDEAMERFEMILNEKIDDSNIWDIKNFDKLIQDIWAKFLWK